MYSVHAMSSTKSGHDITDDAAPAFKKTITRLFGEVKPRTSHSLEARDKFSHMPHTEKNVNMSSIMVFFQFYAHELTVFSTYLRVCNIRLSATYPKNPLSHVKLLALHTTTVKSVFQFLALPVLLKPKRSASAGKVDSRHHHIFPQDD